MRSMFLAAALLALALTVGAPSAVAQPPTRSARKSPAYHDKVHPNAAAFRRGSDDCARGRDLLHVEIRSDEDIECGKLLGRSLR